MVQYRTYTEYSFAPMQTSPLFSACRHLLEPIARLLIRSGMSWADFAELSKQAFVKVARQDYGLQGRPTNTARVAILTGLSRREVTRVKNVLTGREPTGTAPASRISQILTGWHTDSEFLAADGSPAELPRDGDTGSFAALLKRYAGDMPHGAVSKEMEQLGLVVRGDSGLKVTARDYIRSPGDPDMLRQAGVALHDHAATVVHNVDPDRASPPMFERMATRAELSPADADAFREFVAGRGQQFLEEMDAWLAARDASRAEREDARDSGNAGTDKRKEAVRTGIGLYLIHDRTQGTRKDD